MMDVQQFPNTDPNILNLEIVRDYCRVCMSKSEEMTHTLDEERNDVIDKIQFCTGVLITHEDGLPSKICTICLGNLSVAYNFKTSCLLADGMFKKFLSPIKKEIPDDMKHTFNEIGVKDEEQWDISDGFKESNVNNDWFGVIEENSVQKTKLRVVRNKRGPYKKSKNLNTNKLKPIKRLKHVKKAKDPFTCGTCSVKLENKEQLILHKKDHHRDTECWICEICGKMLTHRTSHYSHVRSHAPPQFACAQCDYKTWYKHDLVKHVRRHDGIKLFQCEYCTSSYYTSSNLMNHIQRVHVGVKRHHCTICNKGFFDRTKLSRHIDSHNDVKRFKCDVCNACFTRRCYWKKHLLRQHNVETPRQRPGRQKVNFIVGQDLLENTASLFQQSNLLKK